VKAVLCRDFGPVANLKIEDVPDPQLGPNDILVEIEASGVNFPDGLTVRGEYQVKPSLPFIPGSEAAGTISAVGEAVRDFAVGNRVIALCVLGGFAEKVVVPASQAVLIPATMTGAAASGFTLAYGTAVHALQDKGGLQPGEILLVLGAAGGVGLAAVEVGKAMGATVIAAASSDDKLAIAKDHGADILVNYASEDLKTALRKLAPAGVDVVIDPVGGSMTEAAVRNLRWGGRLLVIGFTQGDIPKLPLNLLLLKEASAVGVFWGQFTVKDPVRHRTNLKQLFDWFEAGKLNPHVGATYSLSEASAAINHVMERRALGKVVLNILEGSDKQ
jgi:NADPH2:quinone reductase